MKLLPWPPDKLTELLHRAPLQDFPLEVPQPVGVVHLVTPPRHSSHHISPWKIGVLNGTNQRKTMTNRKNRKKNQPVGSHSTSVHMKCSPPPIEVKSAVSTNSNTPFICRIPEIINNNIQPREVGETVPARMTNCPVGHQKRQLATFLSYFFSNSGGCCNPFFTP